VSGQRRRRFAVLIPVAVVLVVVVLLFRRGDSASAGWTSVGRRPLVPTLRELGKVVARNETTVFSMYTGEIIWLIDEGTFVEPGTVIIRFDATKTQEAVELKQKDLIDRKSVVRDAQREVDLEKRRGELDVARLEAELEKAKLERQDVYAHPRDDEKREAELDLKSARLRAEQAQRDFDAYAELYQAGYASRATYKQKQLKLATQKAELAKAQVLHQLALQGSTTEAKRLADLAVAEAEKKLATGRFDAEADVAIAKAGLELAKISLDNFQKDLGREIENLDYASVKAPVAGRVAFIEVYKGSQASQSPIQLGETRSRGQDLCKIADTSALQIKTAVSEMDADRLRVGLEAEVRLPAHPGKVFRAKLASVELVAKDKNAMLSHLALQHSGEAFVNVVGVLLDFMDVTPQEQESLRLGLTAEVTVKLDESRQALVVPWTAVRSTAGASEVRTRKGLRTVRLGESDAQHVEIVEGLSEGDEVCDLQLVPADGNAQGGQP
jgi:multidrug resistance efflux pump